MWKEYLKENSLGETRFNGLEKQIAAMEKEKTTLAERAQKLEGELLVSNRRLKMLEQTTDLQTKLINEMTIAVNKHTQIFSKQNAF